MNPRPKVLKGVTFKLKLTCGTLFVTVNRNEADVPVEVFAYFGKSGSCFVCQINSLCRTISIALRNNIPVSEIIDHLEGMKCVGKSVYDGVEYTSCVDAIAKCLKEVAARKCEP